jgi:hypothetical protein
MDIETLKLNLQELLKENQGRTTVEDIGSRLVRIERITAQILITLIDLASSIK